MFNILNICMIYRSVYHFSLYAIYMIRKLCCSHKDLKTSIGSWASFNKAHKATIFNQKAWFKPYIDINTKLKTEAKNDFEKDLFLGKLGKM